MTVSIWRYAHLLLAIISSAFLIILAATGVILAYDAIDEKLPDYKSEQFQELTLAQVLPSLRDNYFEVLELKVDHNKFVALDAMDDQGDAFQAYIDPGTGEKIGEIQQKSDFIQWITALHRSLFLKETGRAIVGVVSFLLFLISISGFILILKRQKGLRHFFARINRDFFSQYFHVVTGRWLLIPVLVIALTGTIIFMVHLDFFKGEPEEIIHITSNHAEPVPLSEISFFKNTRLADVHKVEFPFIPDDEAEPFIVHLKDRSVTVNQVTGEVMSESLYPYSAVLERINLDWHTGRTSILWAVILGLASLNILFFIYSGFVIMFRRTRTKIKNTFKVKYAEIIILTGSENGTTLFFANQIHRQLLGEGKKSYLAEMNQYQQFPAARHLIVFASTYGLGDPPANADRFGSLLKSIPQKQKIQFSVVGFGSESYEEFCAFGRKTDALLEEQPWAERLAAFYTVNDRSPEDFVRWAHDWSEKTLNALATAPAVYQTRVPDLRKFVVTGKTNVTEDNTTFKVVLKPKKKNGFASGDLLAVYPAGDRRERFYSIGRIQNEVQLMVKLFPDGLGSGYLHRLKPGDEISARIMRNPDFHVPETAQNIAMIANGTGIAPFLGMIHENTSKNRIRLYTGFRYDNAQAAEYRSFAGQMIAESRLHEIHFAFSREENGQYVMDLIQRDRVFFADLLKNGGTVMICGALKMQKDVESVLDEVVQMHNQQPLSFYASRKQILTDCY